MEIIPVINTLWLMLPLIHLDLVLRYIFQQWAGYISLCLFLAGTNYVFLCFSFSLKLISNAHYAN